MTRLLLRDRTIDLVRHGYEFVPRLRAQDRRAVRSRPSEDAVPVRLLGRRAVIGRGPEAVRLFYDRSRMRRRGAMPGPVSRVLFGRGAVHGLDGEQHRVRKALFLGLLMDPLHQQAILAGLRRQLSDVGAHWRRCGGGVVYDSMVEAYGLTMMGWLGVEAPSPGGGPAPNVGEDAAARSRRLAQIVDGFATVGRPYLLALANRRSCDRWAREVIGRARATVEEGDPSPLAAIAWHRDASGRLLDSRTAGVELQNLIRPAIAVARFAAFAAVALAEHPDWAERVRVEAESLDDAEIGQVATAFAHEVRRCAPFVPMLAATATQRSSLHGVQVAVGQRLFLDVRGTNLDARRWSDAAEFDPGRFLGVDALGCEHFVPQGGGDPAAGHRCPGEQVTVGLLAVTISFLASLPAHLPEQDLSWSLRRLPTMPRSGVELALGGAVREP